MRHALVTGGAGFIGSHLVDALLAEGWRITVIDSLDPFYSPDVKLANLRAHAANAALRFVEADVRNMKSLRREVAEDCEVIVHLAARAGVRPSLEDPIGYQDVNVCGTQNLLELAREREIEQFIFASSSSVYGVNPNVPWREADACLLPISPYASTKVSGELLGHVYSHLYGIRFVALRFFTVHGPRQRPDLAIHRFARLMLSGDPVPLYGDGSSRRDYTYVGDVVRGIRAAMDYDGSGYEVINLGNGETVSLLEMVRCLQESLGVDAEVSWHPAQAGDVPRTWAHLGKARALLGYRPTTSIGEGIRRFADWIKESGETSCGYTSFGAAPYGLKLRAG